MNTRKPLEVLAELRNALTPIVLLPNCIVGGANGAPVVDDAEVLADARASLPRMHALLEELAESIMHARTHAILADAGLRKWRVYGHSAIPLEDVDDKLFTAERIIVAPSEEEAILQFESMFDESMHVSDCDEVT